MRWKSARTRAGDGSGVTRRFATASGTTADPPASAATPIPAPRRRNARRSNSAPIVADQPVPRRARDDPRPAARVERAHELADAILDGAGAQVHPLADLAVR